MNSSIKTMLGACTNQTAVAASQYTLPMNVNCNLYPMFQKLGSHYTCKFCPKTPYFFLKNFSTSPACLKSASFDSKRSFLCAETTYFYLYFAATSGFSSCLQCLHSNPEISPFLRSNHQQISCLCLSSIYQYQWQGVKHLQVSRNWAGKNTLSCLRRRPDSLCSFHLGSPNSLPSSKLCSLASIFSSLISKSFFSSVSSQPFSSSSSSYTTDSKSLHVWHCPRVDGNGSEENKLSLDGKPVMAVVLLGWLGAEQKHLKMYANWYNFRGIHAVTFVVPVKDLLSFKPGEIVEQYIEILARELASWMSGKENDGRERCIMFHTFSNTGWFSYGVILEKLLMMGDFYKKIKGCVVDSAPDPEPSPQVWALGFSAALLKKRSHLLHSTYENGVKDSKKENANVIQPTEQIDPPFSEVALLAMLEQFFSVMLKLPYVKRRLSEVISILSKHQPPCPQLYMYSSADKVIPAESIESFIMEQKKAGKNVRACNLQSSPHVDHFRSFPHIYSEQLHKFLEECTETVNH